MDDNSWNSGQHVLLCDLDRLAHSAAKSPTAEDERKLTLREVEVLSSRGKDLLTDDYAFRAFGAALLGRGPKRCLHLQDDFGPQHGTMLAWDRDRMLAGDLCLPGRRRVNATNTGADREDYCDGCQRTSPEVVMATARAELHFILSSLCTSCRNRAKFPILQG